MRKAALLAFALVVCVSVVALALAGTDSRSLAFTAGVLPQAPVVALKPAATMCQGPLPVPTPFAAVELQVGTYGRAGQPLHVTVRDVATGRTLGDGRLAGGYADVTRQRIDVGSVSRGRRIAVCVANTGTQRVALYGSADAASRVSTAQLDGAASHVDVDVVFRRSQPASALLLVPDMLSRMALFKGAWVGTWLLWLLLLGALLAVPVLLARALTSAAAEEAPPEAGRSDQTTSR